MCDDLIFVYREEFSLNGLIENHRFIAGEKYSFGGILGGSTSYCNIYGVFSEKVDNFFEGGRYSYYTSISINQEQYDIIRFICCDDGWVSVK